MSSETKTYLKTVKIVNFRNYSDKTFDFSPKINIIVGENAVGKSNLADVISVLSSTKSFRSIKDPFLLKKEMPFYRLEGHFLRNGLESKRIVMFDGEKRSQKVNDNLLKTSEYLGEVIPVAFTADDLLIIKGSPSERRRFLDLILCQIDKEYLKNLVHYQKTLKERNIFLKNPGKSPYNRSFLVSLTKYLLTTAKPIIEKRKAFISELNEEIKPFLQDLAIDQDIFLEYLPNIVEQNLENYLETLIQADILAKKTTFGITRDELKIANAKGLVMNVASQGQIRAVALGLKLAAAKILEKKNYEIIIILDDVLSELDKVRQDNVLKLIPKNVQTFITTTSTNEINDEILKNSHLIYIEREENK